MDSPNIGKEAVMEKQETKEEVLEELYSKLSELSAEEISAFFRFCADNGVDLKKKLWD